MKRMYGEFQMSTEYGPPAREVFETQRRARKKRDGKSKEKPKSNSSSAPDPVLQVDGTESYFGKLRQTRQSFRNNQSSDSGRYSNSILYVYFPLITVFPHHDHKNNLK